MGDDDLIRRGDALSICTRFPYPEGIANAIRSIPAATPALDEAAMRTRAAWVAFNACLVPPDGGSPSEEERLVCDEACRRIEAIPLTATPEQRLAEALQLPEIKALVNAVKRERDLSSQDIAAQEAAADAVDAALRAVEARHD